MCTSEFSGIACECLKSDETCRAYNGVSISEVDGYRPKTSVLLFIVTKMCIYFFARKFSKHHFLFVTFLYILKYSSNKI